MPTPVATNPAPIRLPLKAANSRQGSNNPAPLKFSKPAGK